MAYTTVQSGEIPKGTQYYNGKLPLGDYTFYMQIDNSSDSPKVVTRCDSPDGIRAATQRTLPEGSHVTQWSVEANDSEASVYVAISKKVTKTFSENGCTVTVSNAPADIEGHYWTGSWGVSYYAELMLISAYPLTGISISGGGQGDAGFSGSVYYNNRTFGSIPAPIAPVFPTTPSHNDSNIAEALWQGGDDDSIEFESLLVARFVINLGTAGGYPGGSGNWDVPGDWNPDPTTTLHLTVNGALSGRHNDPLNDPSYSYVPAENTTQAGYGCGGDGGHGGGGGGGASTIIARQFATNKANSKVIVVTAKRHGYGSGGSKGAKGGDGCILIYY